MGATIEFAICLTCCVKLRKPELPTRILTRIGQELIHTWVGDERLPVGAIIPYLCPRCLDACEDALCAPLDQEGAA